MSSRKPAAQTFSMKADFHIHSYFSSDSDMSPEDIIKFAKKRRLDVIAVTDHNTIKGGLEVEKLSRGKGIIVFVGSEIKTKDGEIIGLNLKREIPSNLELEETCMLIKKQKGFVIVPHPFDIFRRGVGNKIEKIVEYIDAVEVFNSRTLFDKFNRDAVEFAKKYNLAMVSGSDAHFTSEIGSAYMLVNSERNKRKILQTIKKGKTKICGGKTGIAPHWKTFKTRIEGRLSL